LKEILPNSKLIELEGLDHGAAQNYGKPEPIAQEIKSFYKEECILSQNLFVLISFFYCE